MRFVDCPSLWPSLVLLALAGCDATGPDLEPGNVAVQLNASVVQSDTGVVVNGVRRVKHPSNAAALWVDRFFHHEFGGFPELDYPQNTRWSDAWRVQLMHQKEEIERNDSTIFRFYDHGDATVAGVPVEKLTDLPGVRPGHRVGYDSFVLYLATAWLHVVWTGGSVTDFYDETYHEALVSGGPVTFTTTGSAEVAPTTTTFETFGMATLMAMESGGRLGFELDTPPVLSVEQPFVLEFDRPLDPAFAYIVFLPWEVGETESGAKRAFIQPRSATDRVVIPPSTLRDLVADADAGTTAYYVVIEEIRYVEDALVGTFAGGGSYSLPFVQESETSMLLYLER